MTTAKIASSFSATLGNGFISQFLPPHRGHTFPYFLALMAFTVLILAFAQRASGIDTRIWRRLGVSILALAQRASAKIDKYFHPILRILHNISTFGRITPLLKSALYPIWLKYRNIFCANLQDKSQRLGFAHSIHAKSKHNYPILLICQFFSKCFYS